MADSELVAKLNRRQQVIDEADGGSSGEADDGSLDVNGTQGDEDTNVEISESASEELKDRLARRQDINEGKSSGTKVSSGGSVYAEFQEFSRKEIKEYEKTFNKFDINGDRHIDFEELKHMMEKLGAAQTHLALKEMIREVDEDRDNMISFREFLLIFRKAAAGELVEGSGLSLLASKTSVDVTKEGVGGAKDFFEAKIEQLARGNAFEQEIKDEQMEKKREAEEKKQRRMEFKAKQAIFT